MKPFSHKVLKRLLVGGLALAFTFTLSVSALTADQLKTLLKDYYLDEVTDAVLSQDSIETVLKALGDPYTDYFTAEEYQAFLASMKDEEICGIGINAEGNEKGLLIAMVHKDSPAEKAGLKEGDIITRVDENDAQGKSPEAITQWLRGEEGVPVTVQVLHPDGSTGTYTMTRAIIVIPATTYDLVDGHVGYINCKTFGEQTKGHFLDAVDTYPQAKIWVVDLRTNPGGMVMDASQTLGVFLGKHNTAWVRDGKDQYGVFVSEQDKKTLSPVIVLTSPWTASASEIFASVIRDLDAGVVVGEKTYGKGVAQILLSGDYPEELVASYFPDGDALKITGYRYFTPSLSTADTVGVIPHLLVDAADAGNIALLFTSEMPKTMDYRNYLRMHIGTWRWYLDLTKATTAENRPYFTELLEALPPSAEIFQGTAGGKWNSTDVASVALAAGLSDYQSRGFGDVASSPWSQEIQTLATFDILRGQGDGSFSPTNSMTRAEFCALLVQAMGLRANKAGQSFSDVPADAWYANQVKTVQAAGLMEGVGGGQFQPMGTVTEEQLITVLARAGVKLNAGLYESAKTWDPQVDPAAEGFSSWAQKWVWLLDASQVNIVGEPMSLLYHPIGEINPQDMASREEAAALLYNLLLHTQILPILPPSN